MLFSNIAIAATMLATSALAAPGIFMVNCYNGSDGVKSVMAYYNNNATSTRPGNFPDDTAVVNSTGLIQWEAHRITGRFRKGKYDFTTYIDSQAQEMPSDTFQGIGYANPPVPGAGSLWNVYHDYFGVVLYNDSGLPCIRTYKAFLTTPGGYIEQ